MLFFLRVFCGCVVLPTPLVEHPHDDEPVLITGGEFLVALVPAHDLDLSIVSLQSLVHGEVGRRGQAFDLPVLAGLQLEDFEKAVVAPAGDVALVFVPTDAFQLRVVRDGDLRKKKVSTTDYKR